MGFASSLKRCEFPLMRLCSSSVSYDNLGRKSGAWKLFGKQKFVLVSHISCWSQLVFASRVNLNACLDFVNLNACLDSWVSAVCRFDVLRLWIWYDTGRIYTAHYKWNDLCNSAFVAWIFPIIQTVIASVVKCCSLTSL